MSETAVPSEVRRQVCYFFLIYVLARRTELTVHETIWANTDNSVRSGPRRLQCLMTVRREFQKSKQYMN